MSAKRWMLDTNTVSHLVKGHPGVLDQLAQKAPSDVVISVITEGELRFGLAKRPEATRLKTIIGELFQRVTVLPWQSSTAQTYGDLRARLEKGGKVVGSLDLLIAAHALDVGAILVSNDAGFNKIGDLPLEDWIS